MVGPHLHAPLSAESSKLGYKHTLTHPHTHSHTLALKLDSDRRFGIGRTALDLAVSQGWGGKDSGAKRETLYNDVLDLFEARSPVAMDIEKLAGFLAARLSELFNMNIEDESEDEVASLLVRLFATLSMGDRSVAETVMKMGSAAPGSSRTKAAPGAEADGSESESDCESEGESESGSEDSEGTETMGEGTETMRESTQMRGRGGEQIAKGGGKKDAPRMDDDGFQDV